MPKRARTGDDSRTPQAVVAVVDAAHPGDTGPLEEWLDANPLARVLCVLGKTEGNGCVNDFTRGYATSAVKAALERAARKHGHDPATVHSPAIIMSGGTEGVLCPHFIVFAESADPKDCLEDDEVPPGDERLLLVTTHTRDFLPEEIGTLEMMRETEKAVSKAWRSIFPPEQPDLIPDFFVQIKCPLLTPARIAEAASRGKTCVTDDCYRSMALSRGASSLGAALSRDDLLEFLTDTNGIILSTKVTKPGDIEQEHICMDTEDAGSKFYSNFVSSSAGVELMHCEILIIGNGPDSRSRHKVSCGFMRDAIDIDGVKACVERLGGEKIVTVLAKADPAAFVRGRRTTQLSDSDIHPTRHARAAVGGVVAAATGDPRVYVSGGAEHQGPSGGGSLCAISIQGPSGGGSMCAISTI